MSGRLPWRVGRKVGRTVYDADDELIGVMDTREMAEFVVAQVRERFDLAFLVAPYCDWCGTAVFPDFEQNWHDRHGDFDCIGNTEDGIHEPAEASLTGGSDAEAAEPSAGKGNYPPSDPSV